MTACWQEWEVAAGTVAAAGVCCCSLCQVWEEPRFGFAWVSRKRGQCFQCRQGTVSGFLNWRISGVTVFICNW